jgi:hypothetical protein
MKNTNTHPSNICCLCKQPFTGYGNNPSPLYDDFTINLDADDEHDVMVFSDEPLDARCCDTCNSSLVLPFRMRLAVSGRDFIKSQDFKNIQERYGYKPVSVVRDTKIDTILTPTFAEREKAFKQRQKATCRKYKMLEIGSPKRVI